MAETLGGGIGFGVGFCVGFRGAFVGDVRSNTFVVAFSRLLRKNSNSQILASKRFCSNLMLTCLHVVLMLASSYFR